MHVELVGYERQLNCELIVPDAVHNLSLKNETQNNQVQAFMLYLVNKLSLDLVDKLHLHSVLFESMFMSSILLSSFSKLKFRLQLTHL